MYKQIMMKQETANEGAGASTGYSPAVETPPSEQGAATPPANAEAAGDKLDQYGYAKAPDKSAEKVEVVTPPAVEEKPPEKLEDIKDAATGYGIKAPPAPKDGDPAPAEVVPPVEKPPEELTIDTKGLDEKEATKLVDFAKANKLSKEAAQALVEMRKSESVASLAAQQAQAKAQIAEIAKLKAGWHKELASDPNFGGDKFEKSLMKVEKVLADFMPSTKKELTARGSMLPPYVMRDLAKIADTLYSNDRLIVGESGSAPKDKEEKVSSPLDYYK